MILRSESGQIGLQRCVTLRVVYTDNSQRMADLNQVSQEWSDAVQREIAALSAHPNAVMITPMVMEIIAEKVAHSGAGDVIVPGGIARTD
jgi:hypothetical protein